MKDLTTDPGAWSLEEKAALNEGISPSFNDAHVVVPSTVTRQRICHRSEKRRRIVRIELGTADVDLLAGIERAAQELGWDVQDRQGNLPDKVDGVLTSSNLISGLSPDRVPAVPTVSIEATRLAYTHRVPAHLFPSIAPNLSQAGDMAALHLMSLASEELAYFASAEDIWSQSIGSAFLKSCMARGIKPRMIPAPAGSPVERAEQLLSHVDKLPLHCAILADHDRHAVEIIAAIRHLGLRVPEDMVVLGIGNLKTVQQRSGIPVSSIDLNLDLLGHAAAHTLDRAMNGLSVPCRRRLVPPKKVVTRQSTTTLLSRFPGIAKAVQIVRTRYTGNICVSAIARECGMSVRNLHRLYRSATGNTIGKDLIHLRMQAAKRLLLLEESLPLDPIAMASGLGNSRNLCRLFKKHFGQPPGQWRSLHLVDPTTCP